MSSHFEELDRQPTAMGEISLRRRLEPTLQVEVYEVKLDDEFLMSSLFTVAEEALGTFGLARLDGDQLDVIVGGLGLGHTAAAVLQDARVRSLTVVDALPQVIGWHQDRLVPLGAAVAGDSRCDLRLGDFFGLIGDPTSDLPERVHAVLVDIDHSPTNLLHPSHAAFYTDDALRRLVDRLHPGGVFALWSDDPPEQRFLDTLAQVFPKVEAHVVDFANHYTDARSSNTIYVGSLDGASS